MTKRILVVEDHEENRRIMRDLLTSAGLEMIEALTGEDGVRAAESERPDLILMDIQLPSLDGYEATRRIKENPALRSIPIIAVTSYALSGDEIKAREAGCDAIRSSFADAPPEEAGPGRGWRRRDRHRHRPRTGRGRGGGRVPAHQQTGPRGPGREQPRRPRVHRTRRGR